MFVSDMPSVQQCIYLIILIMNGAAYYRSAVFAPDLLRSLVLLTYVHWNAHGLALD